MSTPMYYTEFHSEAIDTQNLFYAISANRGNIEHELLIEFRSRLEDLLFDRRLITVPFHPLRWRYHRSKFLSWNNHDWHNEEKDVDVFRTNYFLRDAKFGNEVTFSSLTDDEKVQIVVPMAYLSNPRSDQLLRILKADTEFSIYRFSPWENLVAKDRNRVLPEFFQNLNPKRKKEILNQIEKRKRHVSQDDREEPYEWYRWGFDLYDLDQCCELDFIEDREDFEFFFAWRLYLTDLYDLDSFLLWHLINTFKWRLEDYKEFIEVLFMKYERIVSNPHIKTKVDRAITKIADLKEDNLEIERGSNRNIKIGLPKVKERSSKDGLTALSQSQTVTLIKILRQNNIIFKDGSYQSNTNIAKAFEILTGYGSGGIRKGLSTHIYPKDDLVVLRKALSSLISLIDRELK